MVNTITVQGLRETFDFTQREEMTVLLAEFEQLDSLNFWTFYRVGECFFYRRASWDTAQSAASFETLLIKLRKYLENN